MSNVMTPWGMSQSIREIAPGITNYTTASHGGIHLADWRLAEMVPQYRKRDLRYCPAEWFEEDCEWALVALSWPQFFRPDQIEDAIRTFDMFYAKKAVDV